VALRTSPRPPDPAPTPGSRPSATLGELRGEVAVGLADLSESPAAEARLLVCGLLGLAPLDSTLRRDDLLSAADTARIRQGLARRRAGEPTQRIVGWTEFQGLRISVDESVLIPRPETEELVERALAGPAGSAPSGVAVDVGTGSGAIALALKALRPGWQVLASEISPAAAACARHNSDALGLAIGVDLTSLLEGLPHGLDLVVSNPPYLPESWRAGVDQVVLREPDLALWGGPDGLGVARPLVVQAGDHLRSGGELHLELDPVNVRLLAGELSTAGWLEVEVAADLAGRERFLKATRW